MVKVEDPVSMLSVTALRVVVRPLSERGAL